MSEKFLNIRMHASLYDEHLSGAERLVETSLQAENVLLSMLQRAIEHPRGRADLINLQVEEIPRSTISRGRLLNFSGFDVEDWQSGRMLACQLLTEADITLNVIKSAMAALADGAAPDGSSMRGAMLVDVLTGERLEADQARGVRASRMDLTAEARSRLRTQLAVLGLDNPHVVEALTLASKVISAPGIIAELCWSDDPDYLAGYVATAAGYQRISRMKPDGEVRGGRAFFVSHGQDISNLVDSLTKKPLLIDSLGTFSRMLPWTH